MGTNLGIKLVEKGILVSGTDILDKNIERAKEYGALNSEFDSEDNYDLTIFDKGVSGKIPFSEREGGIKLSKLVNEGKVSEVVVEELSRLGRNTIDTLTTLKFFEDNGVNVIVKSMGNLQSMVNGKKNPIWNLITSVMSSLYELERENILERTEMGRKMYVMNGGKLGRKVGTTENRSDFMSKDRTKKIFNLLEKGKSVRDISGRLGVST